MIVYDEIRKDLLTASSIALGVFDGVHTGHARVIKEAVQKSEKENLTSAVITFSTHPKHIVANTAPSLITSFQERLELFESLGVNSTVVLDFNEELSKMTALDYFNKILLGCFHAKSITVGYNHRFGSDKKGNTEFLKEHCTINNINLSVIAPVKIQNHTVSSSAIRKLLLDGNIELANEFLGRTFKLTGEVIYGQQLGRKLGYPTANLDIEENLITPGRGVYAGVARVDGIDYRTVINIGRKPTVGKFKKDLVEAHILDFDRDIYGKNIELFFQNRIRNEQKFDSLDSLKQQIKQDCQTAINYSTNSAL